MACYSAESLLPPQHVLVLTCNRAEIYFSSPEGLAELHATLLAPLRRLLGEGFEHALYSLFAEDCLAHLVQVVAGLDSLVVGESQIRRQVKEAYEKAASRRTLPAALHFLFQKALKLGKGVRSQFPDIRGELSMEGSVSLLLKSHLEGSGSLLLVGNSEMNRLISYHLVRKGSYEITLATREPSSWSGVGKVASRSELNRWHHYDAVIAATRDQNYLITEPASHPIKTRILIDLSVPRIIDPQLKTLPTLSLYHIEEVALLRQAVSEEAHRRLEEAKVGARLAAYRYEQLWQNRHLRLSASTKS